MAPDTTDAADNLDPPSDDNVCWACKEGGKCKGIVLLVPRPGGRILGVCANARLVMFHILVPKTTNDAELTEAVQRLPVVLSAGVVGGTR